MERVIQKLMVAQLAQKFPIFCGTQRLIPHSQQPLIGLYPQNLFHFLKLQFNILPPIPGSLKWSLLFRFYSCNFMCISLSPTCATCFHPTHPAWYGHPCKSEEWVVQIAKLIMQFSTPPVTYLLTYSLSLRSTILNWWYEAS
jgi:hypothetical protein